MPSKNPIRRYFITGLLVWVPIVITVWVLSFLVGTMDQTLLLLPSTFRPETLLGFYIPGIGAVLTLLVIFLTGVFAANILGQRLVRVLGARAGAHTRREFDLQRREAGERHAVLSIRPGFSQSPARTVAEPRDVDDRVHDGHARR